MFYLGNKEILKNPKIGFLCSRKVPVEIILKTYDWAIEQREKGNCVISGFHSKIEKDVFHYLLKGTQPIILVLARNMMKRWPKEIKTEVEKGRLLIISPFIGTIRRSSKDTAYKRNKFIVENSSEIYIPFFKPGGQLSKLLKEVDKI